MLKEQRHQRIMSALQSRGVIDNGTLAGLLPGVSKVTIRRDIADLAERGVLKRTHGGAVLPESKTINETGTQNRPAKLDEIDAVILPPINDKGSQALRRQIARRGIPFLAESAPQSGGVYLGPDNFGSARELGQLAGTHAAVLDHATVLLISQNELANTQARSDGFAQGFSQTFDGSIDYIRLSGGGSFSSASRLAHDAFEAGRRIDIVFGVNDQSALAGIEAAKANGQTPMVYAAGGERADFVAELGANGLLKAVAAYFPEIVGAIAIDRLADAIRANTGPADDCTPHAILTSDNFSKYFEHIGPGWRLRAERFAELTGPKPQTPNARTKRQRIGFMPHYPAHDWYRNMIQAMHERADTHNLELALWPPHESIAEEVQRLQKKIATKALAMIESEQTVILGDGATTLALAEQLRTAAMAAGRQITGLTVITNSMDVLNRLHGTPGIKVILTGGEYQASHRCLVGPSLGALFERMRADLAFLSVNGVSTRFGISVSDERRALASSRFAGAARSIVALADHTIVGSDANHRITGINQIDTLVTDDGVLPADRQNFREAGVDLLICDELKTPGPNSSNSPVDDFVPDTLSNHGRIDA